MKRPGKKVATDRSFVVALSRGLDVLRAFQPNDGLLGNQEIAARTNLPKPTVSRLTYTLTRLGYLTPVPRFEKYQLAPAAMARLTFSRMPPRTAALSAFTGGLSTVTMAMTSRRSSLTTSFTGISLGGCSFEFRIAEFNSAS